MEEVRRARCGESKVAGWEDPEDATEGPRQPQAPFSGLPVLRKIKPQCALQDTVLKIKLGDFQNRRPRMHLTSVHHMV